MAENRQPEARHEHADVNPAAIARFGIGLVFLCIISLALLVALFHYFQSVNVGTTTRVETAIKLPPAPTLETTPIEDLHAIRAAEEQSLHSYGWVDPQHGIVRIPIDRAIDLVVQRGLPSRPQSEMQTAARDVSVPTESSLGPKMQPPGGPLGGELK